MHSAIHDYWPHARHGLRTTPRGEKPLSTIDYEKQYGKEAKSRQIEIWKEQGLDPSSPVKKENISTIRGYND